MMKQNGEFDVVDKNKVEAEFPCPKCSKTVKGVYKIKLEEHADETTICNGCGESYDIIVLHDDGTGTVNVPALKDQRVVKAQGLP